MFFLSPSARHISCVFDPPRLVLFVSNLTKFRVADQTNLGRWKFRAVNVCSVIVKANTLATVSYWLVWFVYGNFFPTGRNYASASAS